MLEETSPPRPLRGPTRRIQLGEASRLCRLTPRAIRLYEAEGLVRSTRAATGHRLFDDAAIERLNYIGQARRMGLSLREVHELLDLGEREGEQAQRERLQQTCRRLLSGIEARRREIEHVLGAVGDREPRLQRAG